MSKVIQWCGDELALTDYQELHRFANQKVWAARGIPLDPVLRPEFDMTPHHERDPREIADWWCKPYIVTRYFSPDSYEDYCDRMPVCSGLMSEAEFDQQEAARLAQFNKDNPNGFFYEALVLNGGSWDRPTSIGFSHSLEGAIADAMRPVVDYGF